MDNSTSRSFRTPLGRARGLGSAHSGTHHWLGYRLASLALVPLNLWLVYSLIRHLGVYHQVLVLWIREPLNASLLILNIVFMFHHAAVGLEEVLADYVQTPLRRLFALAAVRGVLLVLGLACTVSVLTVAFGNPS
ncbi:MAG: succinate dehydrogenase, hydrophobic membrane anchor protein [Pseudomonadota bacterium]|nr:succinate dehydrogenase, hydrophobic membrane anchor protein [Pseudomonadota bacterium]